MERTLGQSAHEGSQVIGLFQSTFTDLRNVRKVSTNLRKKLPSNDSFPEEQSVKGVGVVPALFGKSVETL